MPAKDPEVNRRNQRNWYARQKEAGKLGPILEAVKERSKNARKKTRDWLAKIKLEHGCTRCGYREHQAALDYHHIDPETKVNCLARMGDYSKKKIEEEIAKCILLCANCHRILHYEERCSS